MPLWKRAPEATSAAATPTPGGEPDPIAVFAVDTVAEGFVPWQARRLSDSLNAGEPVRVRPAVDDGEPAEWSELDLDTVIAIAAPPRSDPGGPRVARRRHAVELRAGPYRFNGIVHMPAGADPDRFVARTAQRWLPVTSCIVTAPDGEWEVEVVLVNMEHVSRS